MCNIWKKQSSDTQLQLPEVENFFKKANNFYWVGITGGEPFLRADLQGIVEIVLKYCNQIKNIHFATNGVLNDSIFEIVRFIHHQKNNLPIVFTVSIDGIPSVHNKIRGVEGVWEKAVNTFIKLKETKNVKAQIGFTISKHNLGNFEECFNALKDAWPKLKFDDINVNVFQKSGFYYDNLDMEALDNKKVSAEISKILQLDNEGFSINNFLRRNYLKLYNKYSKTNKCPLKCQALSSTCFLDPYGNLYPCAVYNKKLLNIKKFDKNLSDIWNSDYAKQLSYECSNHVCPSCWSPCDAFSAIGGSLYKVITGKA